MNRRDVEVLVKKTLFKSYFQIDLYEIKHRLFGGGWSRVLRRELFERGHAVGVLLFDPDRDALVLIEQFRIGAYAALDRPWFGDDASPWLVEIVAGIIEKGEGLEGVARREAREEAGCEIGDMFEMVKFFASPGACTESLVLYCGRVDSTKADGVHGLEEEGEDIRVRVVPCREAFAWLDAGRITNATCLIALQWLRIHHDDVKARWA